MRWKVLLLTLALLTAVVADASATPTFTNAQKRIFLPDNAKLDIDGVDDYRIDAGIAILDAGVDLDHPDLNVVAGVECVDVVDVGYCEAQSPESGNDIFEDGTGVVYGHGTGTALDAAAIDNGFGGVGVAPGARIYALRESEDIWSTLATKLEYARQLQEAKEEGKSAEQIEALEALVEWKIHLTSTIGAMRWVAEHAGEVDVAVGGLHSLCSFQDLPVVYATCASEAELNEFEEAAEVMVDAGVVWVMQAGNLHTDAAQLAGPSNSSAITTSAMADWDGLPGGKGPLTKCGKPPILMIPKGANPNNYPELDYDDTLSQVSNWGADVDIAAPGCPTSSAGPPVAGAAAVLASLEDREDYGGLQHKFVEAIREKLLGDGDCAVNGLDQDANVGTGGCDWTDDSFDGWQEPLLNVGDESVFGPGPGETIEDFTVPGSEPGAVDSDVNGDGYADLVTLRANGVAYVHPGNAKAEFGSGESTFSSAPLDPAQYDGVGEHVVDVADVAGFMGEKRSDLVTLTDEGDVHVYAGRADLKFEEEPVVSELDLTPGLLEAGGVEPIAVADVDGGGHGDLVAYDDRTNEVVVYRGYSEGSFGPHRVVASTGIESALHTESGREFVDVADVTGDRLADLVAINDGDLEVFKGQRDATFAAPVVSHEGEIESAMLGGSGYEPVGLADVTGDLRADLALVKAGTVYLYPGAENGQFGVAKTSLSGAATSTTFKSGSFEIAALLDVNGSGNADLVAILASNDTVRAVLGEASGGFTTGVVSSGTFPTTQHFDQSAGANELAAEKPSWRRRGCDPAGCGWVAKSVPPALEQPNDELTGISCTSLTHCFAVGHLTDLGTTWTYGRVWNGSNWASAGGPPENGGTVLNGVSCTSSAFCVAVGHEVEPNGNVLNFAAHWDGSKWTRKEVPNTTGLNDRLTDVSCTSATFCLATGYLISGGTTWAYGRVWDGSAWSKTTGSFNNAGTVFSGVSCSSSTACTAVGHRTEGSDVLTFAVGWNGTTWGNAQSVPDASGAKDNRLTDVSCTSATFCLATGYLTAGGTTWAYGRQWDGSAWSKATGYFPNEGVVLNGVSCTSPIACTAVGHRTAGGEAFTFAAGWGEADWSGYQQTPNVPGADESRLADVSCVLPFCTAVGTYVDGGAAGNLAAHSQ